MARRCSCVWTSRALRMAGLGGLACMSVLGATAGSVGAAPAARAHGAHASICPLKPTSSSPRGEAWAFTASGTPASAHPGLASSYTHGRGSWGGGRGKGTICRADRLLDHSSRELVLTVRGRSRISPGVTRLGRRGVALVLSATVSASDAAGCAVGTRATVMLFASYHEVHRDSVQLRFAGACSFGDATFLGAQLRVLIARDGHQVNGA